jgi:rsbT antagonist protein RsbS
MSRSAVSGRAGTIPVIRLRHSLLVSIQVQLTDQLIDQLKSTVARTIQVAPVGGLLIEVSGVDVFDSYIARSIRDVAQMAQLMGVRTILVGLDPGMAMTLVEMGMLMQGVRTQLDLDSALDWLETEQRHGNDGTLLDSLLAGRADNSEISGL